MANMFGALNRFIARLDSEPQPGPPRSSSPGGFGFQVLQSNNPELSVEPWFDFIIGINGRTIDNPDHDLFATEVRNCAGSAVNLGVYSAKGQQIRETYVPIPPDGSGLGLSLQWTPLNVVEDVWHILDVMPNSPADVAGLLPYSDYVIGSPEGVLRGEAGLGELVEEFMNRPLRLWVYNNEYDVTRLITITPHKGWGGDGSLGCVLGFGALHRIPAPLTEPPQAPGETLFDTSQPSSDQAPSIRPAGEPAGEFLVPANMQFQSPSPPQASTGPPPGGRSRKQRAHHAAPVAGLDDYFAEGEKKSKEMDNAPTPKPSGGLPPPPKGGPPKAASPAPVESA